MVVKWVIYLKSIRCCGKYKYKYRITVCIHSKCTLIYIIIVIRHYTKIEYTTFSSSGISNKKQHLNNNNTVILLFDVFELELYKNRWKHICWKTISKSEHISITIETKWLIWCKNDIFNYGPFWIRFECIYAMQYLKNNNHSNTHTYTVVRRKHWFMSVCIQYVKMH